MADAHEESGGGNPYTFLFLLAGAMLAALVFKAIHTGIPLTAAILGTTTPAAVVSSAPSDSPRPVVTETKTTAVPVRKKKRVAPVRDRWTTITLDADGHVISVVHY